MTFNSLLARAKEKVVAAVGGGALGRALAHCFEAAGDLLGANAFAFSPFVVQRVAWPPPACMGWVGETTRHCEQQAQEGSALKCGTKCGGAEQTKPWGSKIAKDEGRGGAGAPLLCTGTC